MQRQSKIIAETTQKMHEIIKRSKTLESSNNNFFKDWRRNLFISRRNDIFENEKLNFKKKKSEKNKYFYFLKTKEIWYYVFSETPRKYINWVVQDSIQGNSLIRC